MKTPTFRRQRVSVLRRILSLVLLVQLLVSVVPQSVFAYTCGAGTFINNSQCRVYLTSGTTWTVPSDWSSNNTIEVLGGGAAGDNGLSPFGGTGGGGGGYSAITSVNLTSGGSVSYAIGAGGGVNSSGGDTYFCNSTSNCASIAGTAVQVGAKGGVWGGSGGAGGASGSGVGSTKYSGGAGGTGDPGNGHGGGGGGGGGAASAAGVGGVGASTVNDGTGFGATGGAGSGSGGGSGGAGDTTGTVGGVGKKGTNWDSIYGSGGGGGGGAGDYTSGVYGDYGGDAGLYGGGGGGGGWCDSGCGPGAGLGKQGIIVITYTPMPLKPTLITMSAQSFSPTTATIYGFVSALGELATSTSAVGFAYSTDATLTTGVSTTTQSGVFGTGTFSAALSSLSTNTVYYYRAYGIGMGGTSYGTILSFGTGNATPVRMVILYQGAKIKIFGGGKMKIYQK